MAEVLGLGEVMIRLTPPGALRLEQTATLDLDVGGAELNTLVGLSRLGVATAWLSKLPDTPLGRLIASRGGRRGPARRAARPPARRSRGRRAPRGSR
jgi:2-dehydro-3-deoxygluconokinase